MDWKYQVYDLGGEGAITGSDVSRIVEVVGPTVNVGDKGSSYMHGIFSKDRNAFCDFVIPDLMVT